MTTAPICPACDTAARLTDGAEIYPHRPDLADKPIWACTICEDTYVGCHPGTETPLGFPADAGLREARMLLHRNRIDPLWKGAPDCGAYRPESDAARKQIQRAARARVYRFLANRMGLTEEACHTGMFTVEQCREAYAALNRVTYLDVRKWAQVGDRPAKPKKERKAKAPTPLPEPTEAERGAAAIAAVVLRAALSDPSLMGEASTAFLDFGSPRRGAVLRTWAGLPGFSLMSGAYHHDLLPGWQYSMDEVAAEMIPDLEALAERGERPTQATSQGVAA
ncbi:zinc-finger-containing protein [Methylobacterium sp. V23]|uniref:zinc-finger-containing protein n=1 Tax=Methylobacterium sp. V23 TaxID=2044878 RepID=UPI000CDB3F31|nr:zinc-finger-containing protein [Methylobacterium sp. V23]POR42525.1 hypothetical protein CRT23_12085 [Methylobacterium sp. V23]